MVVIYICLLIVKLTPENTRDLPAWWIWMPTIKRYKIVLAWRNQKSWSEPSDDSQDTSYTHVSWHIRRWCLKWKQTPQWWVTPILSLACFLLFPSCCKYRAFPRKKRHFLPVQVSHSYQIGVAFVGIRHHFNVS